MNPISSSKAHYFGQVARAFLLSTVFLCSGPSGRSQSELPEGNGKATIEAACVQCHDLQRVTRARFTRADWQKVVNNMISYGVPLSEDERAVVTDYLTRNFLGQPKPVGVVIPGNVEVSIKEWTVPTPGSRPHDPLVAPDGSIWYAGIQGNLLGRFDPETNQFKEYRLKTPKSGPHGLVADKEGNIWFTAQQGGYIGKLDPKTGDVTEYRMPDPKARDPHTPMFDHKGNLWFTLSGSNMVGRIVPKTGEVKLMTMRTEDAHPYGVQINSKGIPFFTLYGVNKLASIDPDTLEIQEYVLPFPDARPRRLAITPDDVIWYGDYPRGRLGRFDPKTGKGSEWVTPSGPRSAPYGVTAMGNTVWLSESGTDKNTVVRFDPKTEKFQSWLIPSG